MVLPALMLAGIAVPALLGARVLRAASPVLVRSPRLAIAVLVGAVTSWFLALLALGPVLAWISTGPALLAGSAADVCQRCVAASNPFGDGATVTAVPTLLLLGVPALLATALVVAGLLRTRPRRHESRELGRMITETAKSRVIAGHHVNVVNDDRPLAFSLPARHGGMVLSTGALQRLDETEVQAVIAHEHGHLRQRHHAITTLIDAVAAPLRRIPLVRAVIEALPHYLEIAADDAARSTAGTPALAGALMTLSESAQETSNPLSVGHTAAPVLHATGPDRIRHLVTPSSTPSTGARFAAAAGVLGTGLLLVAGVAVHAPYLAVALIGCA